MAYVKITDLLISETTHKIRRMRSQAMSVYETPPPKIDTPLMAACIEVLEAELWKEAPEFRGCLPEDWTRRTSSARVEFVKDILSKQVSTGVILIESSTGIEYPPYTDIRYIVKTVRVGNLDETPPEFKDWFNNGVKLGTERYETQQKFATVEQQIIAFLRTHNSLNTAIKAMPELEAYIPNHYMERLNTKVERSANKPTQETAKVEVDLDTVVGLAVAHRITTTKG